MLNFTNSPAVNLSLLLLLAFSIVTWSLILAKFWQQTQARRQNEKLKRTVLGRSGLFRCRKVRGR